MSIVENVIELHSLSHWMQLEERSANASEEWFGQITESLAALSDDELLAVTKGVQSHGLDDLDDEFVRGCVNLQLGAEIQRRIARQLAAEECCCGDPTARPM
jgi:hypothetical protein